MSMKYITQIRGIPGTTVRVAVSDVAQYIAAAVFTLNNSPAISVLITCEEENVRYAYGVDPTQGVNQVGHLFYVGAAVELTGGRSIREFRFINDVAMTDGFLQITPFFEIGV